MLVEAFSLMTWLCHDASKHDTYKIFHSFVIL